MADEKKKHKEKSSKPESLEKSFVMLKKPLITDYDAIPMATSLKESIAQQGVQDAYIPIPGFGEFRKYKRVNETRIITPYKRDSQKDKPIKSQAKEFPTIEIENPEKFIFERIKSISVESLDSLLQMVHAYPDLGFVTMNRPHMDLVNDYQPYSYAICNYNDKDESNYVTISVNGLVEIYKGDADFMALDRLLVEYQLYCTLRKIPLFSTFYIWKAFMVWFQKIRLRKFLDAKAKIEHFFAEKFRSSQKK